MSQLGRIATWFASWFSPAYFGRHHLSRITERGYVSPKAIIHHEEFTLGRNIFIDDNVIVYKYIQGGPVRIAERVSIHRDTIIQTGKGGSLSFGSNTHIQPRCIFSAFLSPIVIGSNVQVAPNCNFYSYDHSFNYGRLITEQPLQTKGGIFIEDDVWLGVSVTVLDGVRIGKGSVIGAGSIVTRDIPEGSIVVGAPARVIRMRKDVGYQNEYEETR